MRFLGFIGPSYHLRSVSVDCQRCIGWYPEVDELGTGKEHEIASLVQIPGKKLFATVGSGPIRAEFTTSLGRLFVVSGDTLYEVFADKTSASRGTLITNTGPVSIAENGLQLFLVDGANGYYYQYASAAAAKASLQIEVITFTAVTAGTAGNGITIAYVDDGVAGSETVSVSSLAITFHIKAGVTAAQKISDLVTGSSPASTLVSVTISTGNTTAIQGAHTATHLANGTDSQAASFAQVSSDIFPGADQVTYQDGYLIFNKPGTQQVFISGLKDVTFDALDFTSSEGNPNNVVGVLSDHEELWVFSSQTTSVFYNSSRTTTDALGNTIALFPFERNQGAFVEHGCAAPFSIQKMNNTLFWVGKDDKGSGIVFQAKGYQPQRISTHAVEYAIGTYGDISTATSYTYQENGHHFYCLNFPSADTTWVFDSATNLWHERVYSNNGQLERDRANCHAYAFAKHIVGDYANGNLYELSEDVNDDNGAPLVRKRSGPHIAQDMKSNFHSGLQLDMEVGTGLDGIGLGTDPQVMMRFSDDGGKTWSNEQWRSIGKIGQTKCRIKWWRLGSSRDRVYEVTVTDPVRAILIGAELDVVQGGS